MNEEEYVPESFVAEGERVLCGGFACFVSIGGAELCALLCCVSSQKRTSQSHTMRARGDIVSAFFSGAPVLFCVRRRGDRHGRALRRYRQSVIGSSTRCTELLHVSGVCTCRLGIGWLLRSGRELDCVV